MVGLQGVGLGPSAREYTESEPASNREAIRIRMTFFTSGSFCAMCTAGLSTPEAPIVRCRSQLPEFGKRNEKHLSAPGTRGCGKAKCATGAGQDKIDGISETVTKWACKHGFRQFCLPSIVSKAPKNWPSGFPLQGYVPKHGIFDRGGLPQEGRENAPDVLRTEIGTGNSFVEVLAPVRI